jgi:hypothetical protein
MKYLETEEEKKSFAITSVIFCDSICSILLLRLTSLILLKMELP